MVLVENQYLRVGPLWLLLSLGTIPAPNTVNLWNIHRSDLHIERQYDII